MLGPAPVKYPMLGAFTVAVGSLAPISSTKTTLFLIWTNIYIGTALARIHCNRASIAHADDFHFLPVRRNGPANAAQKVCCQLGMRICLTTKLAHLSATVQHQMRIPWLVTRMMPVLKSFLA